MFTTYKHTINVKWLDRIVTAPIIGARNDMTIHIHIPVQILNGCCKMKKDRGKESKRTTKRNRDGEEESGLPKTALKMESTLGKIFPIKCGLFAEHKKYINWWLTTFLRFYCKPLPPAYIYIHRFKLHSTHYMQFVCILRNESQLSTTMEHKFSILHLLKSNCNG